MDIDVLSRKMHDVHLAEMRYEKLAVNNINGMQPDEVSRFRDSYKWAVIMLHDLRKDMEQYASESGIYDSRHYIY